MSHAMQGHPRQMGHSGEFWQNMVPWRKWQPTPVFLSGEPHGEYEKAKDMTSEDEPFRSKGVQYATEEKQREITYSSRMKWVGQSGNDIQLWMSLVVKANSVALKNNIAKEPGMLGPWIKVSWTWLTGDGKIEHQHFRNQWTKMDEFNSDRHIHYHGQEFLGRNGIALIVKKRV